MRPRVVVTGAFDDLRSTDVRLLEEASRHGELHVSLWSDRLAESVTGRPPRFRLAERRYLLEAIRYVGSVEVIERPLGVGEVPLASSAPPDVWIVPWGGDTPDRRAACAERGVRLEALSVDCLAGFPRLVPNLPAADRGLGRVVVTGCFDWLHSGHIRFFEDVAALGEVYVVVGNDANVRNLKGPGHPLFPEAQRRYMVGSVRLVVQALVSTGRGWLDAEPEIEALRPQVYAVNEDGDRPEKKSFCDARGIRYVVLKREPQDGLPPRSSTELRGF